MTRSRTLPTLPTIAAFVLGAVALAVGVALLMAPRTLSKARALDIARLGDRVLIIAPHPDDEILTAGGTARRLLAQGAQVRVVIVTAGDGYSRAARRISGGHAGPASYLALGNVRHGESLAAATDIGLPSTDVVSLGFPDGGTSALWDAFWNSKDLQSSRTGADRVPYAWAESPGAPYRGRVLADELTTIVRDFHPDTVITSSVYETHPDHAAVAAFSLFALDEAGFKGRHLTGIVHFKRYPYPWGYLPSAALEPPPTLLDDGSTWYTVPLSPADEQIKKRAIEEYRSQTSIADMGVYMRAFVRRNELFNEARPATLATAPTDARPARDSTRTVLVTPRPTIVARIAVPARIGSVDVVRGPGVLWVGIVSDSPITTRHDYRVGMRLVGGSAPSARLDVLVHQGGATVLTISPDSLTPTGVSAQAEGRTLWVAIPVTVLEDHTHALLGTTAGLPQKPPFRTAWRDLAL